jgi:hypothetical protein
MMLKVILIGRGRPHKILCLATPKTMADDSDKWGLQDSLVGEDPALKKKKGENGEEAQVFPPMKSDSMMRWAVLCLSCLAMIGNYYCYDNPAALKTQLQEYAHLNEEQYNLLYTVYSLPNIILPFFGENFKFQISKRNWK